MFERFKSGSYRIEDTELANSKKNSKFQVLIKLLDTTNVKFYLDVSICHRNSENLSNDSYFVSHQKNAKGSQLLNLTFLHLELSERDYFGLKFCQNETEVRQDRKFCLSQLCNQTGEHFLITTFRLFLAMA